MYERKDLNEYHKYRLDARFKFNVFDFPKEFDLLLIEKYGIYRAKNRGDNMDGVSRDHMYSIRDGFDNKIDTNLISHPANCRLIFQKDNAIKHRKSIITVEELKERIQFLEDELINALTKKTSTTKEINVADQQKKISELRKELIGYEK